MEKKNVYPKSHVAQAIKKFLCFLQLKKEQFTIFK